MERHTLSVKKNSFGEKFPSYNKPNVVGYFSLDSEQNYCGDLRQLKYIHFPSDSGVRFNLDHGREHAIKKDDNVDGKLNHITKWMLESSRAGIWFASDFVCYRGLLTMLMCTPYEKNEGWIICATKWKRTIFLCAKETAEKCRQREQMSDRQKQCSSWGYKFEQYMSSDKPNSTPDTAPPVNEREELCVMFRTKLNNHTLLFGAEMDGVRSKSEVTTLPDLAQAEFVELKTSRQIDTLRQDNNFRRFKLIKWWCQSFLVGIARLVCGFRDDQGVVHSLKHFEVSKLPKMAADFWDPCVCMNFCDRFLEFVRSVVVEESPDTVWKFEWKPYEDVTAVKILGPSELSILPHWFTAS